MNSSVKANGKRNDETDTLKCKKWQLRDTFYIPFIRHVNIIPHSNIKLKKKRREYIKFNGKN